MIMMLLLLLLVSVWEMEMSVKREKGILITANWVGSMCVLLSISDGETDLGAHGR